MTEIREFGTGLRDHLELHGVCLEAGLAAPSYMDLFALNAVVTYVPASGLLTRQAAPLAV